MSEFRFLHAADLHLDSPMRGLEADPDAPAQLLRGASRAALRNLVNAAIEERVAFLVIAGDLYDGDWQDWRTGHFFTEQAAKLADARRQGGPELLKRARELVLARLAGEA